MKKWISFFLCLMLILAVTGCGNSGASNKTGNQPAGVNDVLEAQMAAEDNKEKGDSSEGKETPTQKSDNSSGTNTSTGSTGSADGLDVDLTVLSSTMIYSKVFDMMNYPEDYMGKTIKVNGLFSYYYDEVTGNEYFACLVPDATACCAQGIEFVLKGDPVYPDDYPELGDEICVTGVFDTYKEGEYTYVTLRQAEFS